MLTDAGRTDGRTTDAGVIGILLAHLGTFRSGELKKINKGTRHSFFIQFYHDERKMTIWAMWISVNMS